MLTDEGGQECFEEAISHKDESERVKTMQEEIKSLNKKHNYELVNTRLVVKDFNQKKGVDFEEKFSPG